MHTLEAGFDEKQLEEVQQEIFAKIVKRLRARAASPKVCKLL